MVVARRSVANQAATIIGPVLGACSRAGVWVPLVAAADFQPRCHIGTGYPVARSTTGQVGAVEAVPRGR